MAPGDSSGEPHDDEWTDQPAEPASIQDVPKGQEASTEPGVEAVTTDVQLEPAQKEDNNPEVPDLAQAPVSAPASAPDAPWVEATDEEKSQRSCFEKCLHWRFAMFSPTGVPDSENVFEMVFSKTNAALHSVLLPF